MTRTRTDGTTGRLACVLLVCAAAILSPGCAATRYSSTETLTNVRPAETLVRSFYVEHIDGDIRFPDDRGLSQRLSPDRSDLNQLLHDRYPAVFNRKASAVPLHVECSGTVPPTGLEAYEMNPLAFVLFWRYQEAGKISVSVLLDNDGAKRKVFVPFRKSQTESLLLFFWPFVVPGRRDWPTIYGFTGAGKTRALRPIFTELTASGIVKALNRMSPEEMDRLVARRHETKEQRSLRNWLFSTTNTTFSVSVDKSGSVFVEKEHAYRPVFIDYAEAARLPEILEQSFDAESRTGIVVADVTGCDPELAADYLLVRLVPAICRTKGVVFDPSKVPPGGAAYRTTASSQGTENGKDVFRIEFESLQ